MHERESEREREREREREKEERRQEKKNREKCFDGVYTRAKAGVPLYYRVCQDSFVLHLSFLPVKIKRRKEKKEKKEKREERKKEHSFPPRLLCLTSR